jgi:hypothetical protein
MSIIGLRGQRIYRLVHLVAGIKVRCVGDSCWSFCLGVVRVLLNGGLVQDARSPLVTECTVCSQFDIVYGGSMIAGDGTSICTATAREHPLGWRTSLCYKYLCQKVPPSRRNF